jgi:predicted membrane channel-forming protein YqfA (hemolysin III family)
MEERTIVIGKKSSWSGNRKLVFSILLAIMCVISIYTLTLSSDDSRSVIYIFFCLPGALFYLVAYIVYRKKPIDLLLAEGSSLIINQNSGDIIIPFADISKVVQKNAWSRWNTCSFGKIIIYTTNGNEYVVRDLADVDDVKTEILMRMPRMQTAENSEQI